MELLREFAWTDPASPYGMHYAACRKKERKYGMMQQLVFVFTLDAYMTCIRRYRSSRERVTDDSLEIAITFPPEDLASLTNDQLLPVSPPCSKMPPERNDFVLGSGAIDVMLHQTVAR